MKFNTIISLVGVLAWICNSACTQQKDELAHDHSPEHQHTPDHLHGENEEDHNHENEGQETHNEIVLSPDIAERFGIQTDTINPSEFNQVIKVTGQIVDNPASTSIVSAPTSGIVKLSSGIVAGTTVTNGMTIATISGGQISGGDRNKTDKATLDAAKRELDRVTPLYKEGIVSQKNYNAALQAYELAKTQYSPAAASGVAKAVQSGTIAEILANNGQYVEAGSPIALITSNKRLTLRADVPDRYINAVPLIQSANIVLPYSNEVIDISELKGNRVSASQQTSRIDRGYIPIYFSFDNNGMALSNTLVDVYLKGAPRQGVISVPKEAIIEQQGANFVFIQIDEEGYEKIPVTLGVSDGERVEIKSGLQGGENVVTSGAIGVKLAETSGVVPEGHSHSH